MRFDGGYLDTNGWYHFGQRYYNPVLGRWSQPDPQPGNITAPKNLDRYLFAGDDPINNTDPTGQFDPLEFGISLFDITSGLGTTGLGLGIAALTGWTGAGLIAGGVTTALGLAELGAGVVDLKESLSCPPFFGPHLV